MQQQTLIAPHADETITATYAAAPASPPVAAYHFDGGNGATAVDQSGRGNTLLLMNTAWTPQGHSGGALEFNGSTSRAELPAPATDLTFSSSFTITAWVYPITLRTGWRALAARQLGTGFDNSWYLGHNGTTLHFFAGAQVSTPLTPGVWTHIAAVKNGATLALYKNGVLAATVTNATSSLPTDANEVGLGGDNNGAPLWSDPFHGRLDDVRFYQEPRTLLQIQSDMKTPVRGQ
jgi:hypothetical protein